MTPLTIVRSPGPRGPRIRCRGDLVSVTVEALRRDLELMIAGRPLEVEVDLTGLKRLDAEGVRALTEAAERLERSAGRLVLVAGPGPIADELHRCGGDRLARPVDAA